MYLHQRFLSKDDYPDHPALDGVKDYLAKEGFDQVRSPTDTVVDKSAHFKIIRLTFMMESSLRRAGWLQGGLCSESNNSWQVDELGLRTLTKGGVARMTGQYPFSLLPLPLLCIQRPLLRRWETASFSPHRTRTAPRGASTRISSTGCLPTSPSTRSRRYR